MLWVMCACQSQPKLAPNQAKSANFMQNIAEISQNQSKSGQSQPAKFGTNLTKIKQNQL